MSKKNYPVFYIPFGEDILESSFCNILQKDQRQVMSGAQADKHNKTSDIKSRLRILETYPLIRDILTKKFTEFAKDLGINSSFKITSSWLTQLNHGDTIQIHNHKNCEWSGIIYFDDDYTDQPPLMFKNPLREFCSYVHEPLAIGYSTDWQRNPEPGLILFFPSFLYHGCREVVRSDKSRKSLAFNIIPVGSYGAADSSMDTSWLNS